MTVVGVDVETANSARSSICSLAIAAGSARPRSWLVKPAPAHFDDINMAIDGITPDAVATAPSFADAWTEIGPALEGRPLVAHNASFDVAAILTACSIARVRPPSFDYVCTARLSRAVLAGRHSYSLPFLCDEFGIALEHHDAASDARGGVALLNVAAAEDAKMFRSKLPSPTAKKPSETATQ